jgi:hypothetical protein
MCKACAENYQQLEEAAREEVAQDIRGLASTLVSAASDSGKNHVEIATALEIARGYLRLQLDAEVLAIVDDLGARGARLAIERLRDQGKVCAPRPHDPMTFGPPDEPLRLAPPAGRHARAPGAAPTRRATWRN